MPLSVWPNTCSQYNRGLILYRVTLKKSARTFHIEVKVTRKLKSFKASFGPNLFSNRTNVSIFEYIFILLRNTDNILPVKLTCLVLRDHDDHDENK